MSVNRCELASSNRYINVVIGTAMYQADLCYYYAPFFNDVHIHLCNYREDISRIIMNSLLAGGCPEFVQSGPGVSHSHGRTVSAIRFSMTSPGILRYLSVEALQSLVPSTGFRYPAELEVVVEKEIFRRQVEGESA